MSEAMFDSLPCPFMVGTIKVWPCASKPGFSWFIAHEGKPFYFQTKQGAMLFAKDRLGLTDHENLCD